MTAERQSPVVRSVIEVYRPILRYSLERPLPLGLVLAATMLPGAAALGDQRVYLAAVAVLLGGIWFAACTAWSRGLAIALTLVAALLVPRWVVPLEREFLTPLDEGTAMDMPITIPGISIGQGIDDLKARNMVLCRYPEVEMVMGKLGRADTPNDPAPLDMIESMISFRPREYWPRRKLDITDASRHLSWIFDQLVTRKVRVPTRDAAERSGLLTEAEQIVVAELHGVLREFAYQRNKDCTRDAAQACLQRLAHDLSNSSADATAALLVARIPPAVVDRFADDWSGDLVPEIVARMRSKSALPDGLNWSWESSAQSASEQERRRKIALAERRRVWDRHVRQLNTELRERAAPTFVFLALRHFLSPAVVADTKLRGELERIRAYRQPPIRPARRSHHGASEPVSLDVDPVPKFDALIADFTERIAHGLVLQTSSRANLAGFGSEMDEAVNMPGWTNVWTMPIQNRVDMLATGVNTTVGIRILGLNLDDVVATGQAVAEVVRQVPGATGVVADPVRGKRELAIAIHSQRASALGLTHDSAQLAVEALQSGIMIDPPNRLQSSTLRVQFGTAPQSDAEQARRLPFWSEKLKSVVSLGDFASVAWKEVPASLKSENGQSRNYVRLNVRDRDSADFVREAQKVVSQKVNLPRGVSLEWTGEFEQRLRAQRRLAILLPAVLFVIFGVLWWTYHDFADAALMLLAVPGALAGGLLMQWFVGTKLSVTVVVGYIACLGMATSTGIIMLVYLRESISDAGGLAKLSLDGLRCAVLNGAVCRLRPKLLTEVTTILGLAPMLWASGVGAEVIRPMAAPVLGGILIADEVIDLLLPVLFFWVRRKRWERLHASRGITAEAVCPTFQNRKDQLDELVHMS